MCEHTCVHAKVCYVSYRDVKFERSLAMKRVRRHDESPFDVLVFVYLRWTRARPVSIADIVSTEVSTEPGHRAIPARHVHVYSTGR